MKYFLFILIIWCNIIKGQSKDTKLFYGTFGLTVITSEVCYQITDKAGTSALIGTALSTTIGLIFGHNKMLSTMGAVTGGMVIRVKFDLQEKKQNKLHKEDYE